MAVEEWIIDALHLLHNTFIICSDTFDENTPPVDEPQFISSLGAAIYEAMQSGDSDAVWLMQVRGCLPFY